MKLSRAVQAVLSTPWAILPEALETIASIAEREHEFAGNLEALEAKLGRPLGNTMTATVRDGVAVLPIEGPLFSKANLFTAMSGASSYDVLARDLSAALENPMVDAVLLNISSPGGAVEGASELSQLIAAADKPVWAYIGGTGASAAYWIASAADRIVVADTAIVGSIGVQSGVTVRDARPGEKAYRFVSSQSPNKNAGPETEAGAREMQAMVDGLAQVFVATIAKNRGITEKEVIDSYGAGAVFVAAEAVKRGMADEISTFEATLKSLKAETETMDYAAITAATLSENRPDLVAEIQTAAIAGVEKVDANAIRAEATAAGAEAERKRIADIEALALPGAEDLIAKFKADGTDPAAAAVEIVKAARAGGLKPATAATAAGHLAALQSTEQDLNPPATGAGSDAKPTDAQAADDLVNAAKALGVNV